MLFSIASVQKFVTAMSYTIGLPMSNNTDFKIELFIPSQNTVLESAI